MKINKAVEVPKGNAFQHDAVNMGIVVGTNVTVMYGRHSDEHQNYLYVIDTENGKSVKIEFEQKPTTRQMKELI